MRLIHGDCLDVMPTLEEESVDSVVCDPPYGIEFMNKNWDHGVPGVPFWKEVLRVTKPGAHLLAFGGTRTSHRLTCAIEDAGFEIRDCVMWVYGSGFPKSLDVSKAIDKAAGVQRAVIGPKTFADGTRARKTQKLGTGVFNDPNSRETNLYITASDAAKQWSGWGTALKPSWEPVVLARKPLIGTVAANVLEHGTGALNIDGCRIGTTTETHASKPRASRTGFIKGFVEGTKTKKHNHGRWPANLVHDGSDEVLELFPETNSGAMKRTVDAYDGESTTGFLRGRSGPDNQHGDSGSAARFFYCAKVSKAERGEGNNHPTVKPLALMQWLCRLITPPGGIVLDPFMGSGSTGIAAAKEGFDFIGIEKELHYYEIAQERIANPPIDDPIEPSVDQHGDKIESHKLF